MSKKITVTDLSENIQNFTQQEVEKVKYIARKELKRRKVLQPEPPKKKK